ncbi:MAG: hypothetical protein R2813_08220 [Flavobacteriales bacterium]
MKHLLGILFLVTLLSTCKKKEEYEFQIVNKTNYNIDVFEFRDEEFELKPNSHSQPFSRELIYDCGCPTNSQTYLAVAQFSDSSGSYSHTIGTSFVTSAFNTMGTNVIEIELADNPDFPNYTFELSIN